MGDTQKLSPDEQIEFAYNAYESGADFTVAVEEEFAILEPETLDLSNRFEVLQASAQGTALEEHLVGELIASEVEVRTGRCENFTELGPLIGERRSQLYDLAEQVGVSLAGVGTHPWSPWQEQRIIDTPHYRANDEMLRYVVWRNNTFGLHVHVGVRGADRAIQVCNVMRNYLPELLALSASSPFVEGVDSGLHSARTQIFTRMFPRCGVPDVYEGWGAYEEYVRMLYRTRSILEHTHIWWSVRPHLAYPTVEIRICDAQPQLGEAQSLAALIYSLVATVTRQLDSGTPFELLPRRLIEENFWRAIRWGLGGEFIDFATGETEPTRARLERLAEWVQPLAEEIGAAPYLAIPTANAAERQKARLAEAASFREIFAEQVAAGEPVRG
jgi:glutamate---cysteine ligase / carboxylate-amine ligase